MRVLIVDDEPMACRGVSARLAKIPDIEIVGECGDGATAVGRIIDLAPDLVFLDVQMPGMDGFDVLRALPWERVPGVIFLTAHEHHAIGAFDVHAVDYVLKPIDDGRFAQAVERARRRHQAARLLALLDHSDERYAARFTVRTGTRIHVVLVEDIEWIGSTGDYAELHTRARTHLLRETMGSLEQRLDPNEFLRIHRSRIVRAACIRELRSIENREYIVTLTDGSQHRSSRTYAGRLERWLRR
jgi:two-component system, LytTR family, response regulator